MQRREVTSICSTDHDVYYLLEVCTPQCRVAWPDLYSRHLIGFTPGLSRHWGRTRFRARFQVGENGTCSLKLLKLVLPPPPQDHVAIVVSSAYSVHQALENCPQNALGFGSDRRWFGNPELHYQCFQAYTSCCAARGSEPLLEHMAERCERSTMDAMAYVLDGRAGTEPTLPHVAPAYVSRLVSPYWRRCRKTPPSILCLDDLMIPCPFKTLIRAFSYKSHSGI